VKKKDWVNRMRRRRRNSGVVEKGCC